MPKNESDTRFGKPNTAYCDLVSSINDWGCITGMSFCSAQMTVSGEVMSYQEMGLNARFTTETVAFQLKGASNTISIVLTVPQWETLLKLAKGAQHVKGGEVKRVRGLVDKGLATLQDDGPGPYDKTNFLGERWTAELTSLGQLLASRRELVKK